MEITGFRKWLPLVVLSLALTIIILDTTILNVALRTIIDDLKTDIQSIQWVITAYSLMLAAFTVTGGRLGDLFGRKKMFMTGAIIFAIGSFITSISPNVAIMILGEAIIEGIGASLMMPATASLLVSNYKGRDRQIGFGIWGGIAAGAAALGPIAGGALTTYFSWRWAFRINVFVAALLVLGSFLIKESKDNEEKPTLDIVGVALSALGLLSLVFGFIEASTLGWFMTPRATSLFGVTFTQGNFSPVPIFITVGIIILSLFGLWENRVSKKGQTPLVSLKLFKNSQFTLAASLTALLTLGQSGMSFALPIFLQGVKLLNPLNTGFAMLPMSLALLFAAPFSGFISKYFQPKRIIQTGLVFVTLGFLGLIAGIQVNSSVWALAPGFTLFGIGMGFMFSQTSNLALSAVSVNEAGEASGVNGTLRSVGQTLGAAILGAILLSVLSTNLISGINSSSVIPENLKAQVGQSVSTQTSNIEFGSGPNLATSGNSPLNEEIIQITREATVDATHTTLFVGIIFIILAFIISTRLPNSKEIELERSAAPGPKAV